MSAIESSLRLQIAEYQANLAKAKAEATRFREKLQQESRSGGSAVKSVADAYANTQAKAAQMQAVNPWAANTAAAKQYAQTVETKVIAAMQRAAAAQAAAAEKSTRSQFLGGSMGGEFDTNNALARGAQRGRNAGGSSAAMRGGGGGANIGMMAMQFQDIAVQAQMGARWSTIIAQQGSQMLSAFGAGGAIFGGVIAIGGAFYTLGEKSREAFEEAKGGAREFDEAMQKAAQGSVSDINRAVDQLAARSKDLGKEWQQLATGGIMPAIEQMVGGASVEDRVNQNAEQQRAALQHRREMGQALAEASAQETQVAELRAAGNAAEADELEKQIKLKRELAAISDLQVDGWVREQLAADAVTKSMLDLEAVGKAREEVLRIEEKLSAEKLRQLDPVERFLALSTQQEAIYESMATKGGMFFESSQAGLEAWAEALRKSGDTEQLAKVLQMLEQASELQKEMNAAQKDAEGDRDKRDAEADRKREEASQTKKQMEAEQAKAAEAAQRQDEAKQSLKEEMMLLEAKASGQTQLVERMERELRIREKMKQIQEQTGATPEQARASAERMVALEERASERGRSSGVASAPDRPSGRIGGVRSRRMMGSGLDEHYRNQIRDGTDATAMGSGGLSRRGTSAIPSRLMGGGVGGGLAGRGEVKLLGMDAKHASNEAASQTRGDSTVNFGGREFDTLVQIKTGIEKLLE